MNQAVNQAVIPAIPPERIQFGHLSGRAAQANDTAFLEALYLASRPDLGALPVPREVVAGIARHQRQLQTADYARRYPRLEDWVIEEGGLPVARLALARGEGTALLRVVDLSVAPQARRRGVARTLLRSLREAGQAQPQAIALRVRADNAPARALYDGLGFTLLRDDGATLELAWI